MRVHPQLVNAAMTATAQQQQQQQSCARPDQQTVGNKATNLH
jgi:hypothetical protein